MDLDKQQYQVLSLLWELGPASAYDLSSRLDSGENLTSVLITLRRENLVTCSRGRWFLTESAISLLQE